MLAAAAWGVVTPPLAAPAVPEWTTDTTRARKGKIHHARERIRRFWRFRTGGPRLPWHAGRPRDGIMTEE